VPLLHAAGCPYRPRSSKTVFGAGIDVIFRLMPAQENECYLLRTVFGVAATVAVLALGAPNLKLPPARGET